MTIATPTRTLGIAAALSLTVLGAAVGASGAARADEQYFPLQSYRVGPYAAGGTGFFGGLSTISTSPIFAMAALTASN